MKIFYINSFGRISFFLINGLFLKNFLNLNFFYQFLIYYNCFYRINFSSQKSRSFINGSTKKLRSQKGAGKSRVGSSSSPTRVGGSKTFPNLYFINYRIKFNKNSYKICYLLIYSNMFYNNYFFLIEDIFFTEIKNKIFLFFLNFLFFDKIFLLSIKIEKNFFLSLSNHNKIYLFYFFNFNPILLLKFSKLLITRSCFENFNDKFL